MKIVLKYNGSGLLGHSTDEDHIKSSVTGVLSNIDGLRILSIKISRVNLPPYSDKYEQAMDASGQFSNNNFSSSSEYSGSNYNVTSFFEHKGVVVNVEFDIFDDFDKKLSHSKIKQEIEDAISCSSDLSLIKISGLKIKTSPFYGHQPYYSVDVDNSMLEQYAKQYKQEWREKEAKTYKQWGNECFKKSQFKGALTYYAHAQVFDPKNPIISFNIGMVFKKQGEIQDAINFFQQAIRFDPNYLKPSYNLADIFVEQKNQESLTYLLDFLKDKSTSEVLPKITKMIVEKWPGFSLEQYQTEGKSGFTLKPSK